MSIFRFWKSFGKEESIATWKFEWNYENFAYRIVREINQDAFRHFASVRELKSPKIRGETPSA